ncbi:hypothetical protein Taro_034579 [Colocasia esculenta]|uniref:CCHC-type domain-containing protein n=1 Tax=Colocasia esculenta TaxID=4460 RepID=A0A843W810_COLES|nr:hypothetical protein [Colocasia esculenta]
MAAQGFVEGQSVIRPPFFDGEHYQYWKMRMECFIRGTDFDLWQVIEVGDYVIVHAEGTTAITAADKRSEDSDVDDVLSNLQKILKKKKNRSRRIQKKERKEKEPVCYECRKLGHLRPDCPRLRKTGQPEKSKK